MTIGKKTRLSRIMRNGKILLCALDQGLEHGPTDFNDKNINPDYVLDIAVKGKFTGMILQKGLAEKYFENYAGQIPLVLKLNGKTNITPRDEAYSAPLASVDEAIKLGADAIGYTIYVGSPREAEMFREFTEIQEQCEDYGIPTIMWAYPRGKYVGSQEKSEKYVSYAARVALELGADVVKLNYTGDKDSFSRVVKAAGKTHVISAGGSKLTDEQFLEKAREIMQTGAKGFAIGRNIWQNEHPLEITEKLKKVIWSD